MNSFWLQPNWVIDPINGSDGNDGAFSSTPVKTWAEIERRYQTQAPTLPQDTTFTFLNGSPTDGSDPIVFRPTMARGARVTFVGAPEIVASGNLAGFTPKDYIAGNLPTTDLGGLGFPNALVVNITKPSKAWAFTATAGTSFSLSQPMEASTISLSAPNMVDTWANGDAFEIQSLVEIDLALFEPLMAEGNNRAIIQNLGLLGGGVCYLGDSVALLDCRCDRRVVLSKPASAHSTVFLNCIFTDSLGLQGGSPCTTGIGTMIVGVPGPKVYGGFGGFSVAGAVFDGNFIVAAFNGSSPVGNGCVFGTVFLSRPMLVGDLTAITPFAYGEARLWGPGRFEISEGRVFLPGGEKAVDVLLQTGGTTISSRSTACSVNQTTGGLTTNIPITPTNIDANDDPVGYGLFLPGHGAISNILGA